VYDVAYLAGRFLKFLKKKKKSLRIFKIKTQSGVSRILSRGLNFFRVGRGGGDRNPSGPENPLETIDFTDPGWFTVNASDP